jgi:hypothetical protein
MWAICRLICKRLGSCAFSFGEKQLRENMYIAAVALMLLGCSNGPSKQTIIDKAQTGSVAIPTLMLETVDFESDVEVRKVKLECSMLEKLSASILDSAEVNNIIIKQGEGDSEPINNRYVLKVTYVDVIPHKWAFLAIRPGSIATVKADVFKNGQLVNSISKAISSKMALGACDRLEKIAVAGGRYISKWAAIQAYE